MPDIRLRVTQKQPIRLRVMPSLIPRNAAATVGTVTTLPAGSAATVVNVGTPQNPVLDFGIPRGTSGVIASIGQGSGVIVNSGDPANPTIGLDAAATVRNYLSAPPYVATRTALKALDTTVDGIAYLNESGREGIFVWRSGNYATQVAADTLEGLYLKASSISASLGAWVRATSTGASVKWFGAAADGLANDVAAFRALWAETVNTSLRPVISDGQYVVSGDIDYTPGGAATGLAQGAVIIDHNNLAIAEKNVLPYTAFAPVETRTLVMDGSSGGIYNHEPTGCTQYNTGAGFDRLYIAWQGNPGSGTENATGQVIYLKTSDDGGATVSSLMAPFTDAAVCNNPITPDTFLSEPRLLKVGTEVWLFADNRGTAGTEGLLCARQTAINGKWTVYRFRRNTSTGAFDWSSSNTSGAPAAGYSLYLSMGGQNYSLLPSDAKLLSNGSVALVLVGLVSFSAAPHRAVILTGARDFSGWTQLGIVPDGVMYIDDLIETSLEESSDGHYRMIARITGQDYTLPVGHKQASTVSDDLRSWSPWAYTEDDNHSVRPVLMQLAARRFMSAWVARSTLRNNIALGLSDGGGDYVAGHPISAENVATDYVHYSWLARDAGAIYALWSQAAQSAAAPRDIRLVRLAQQTRDDTLYAMKSSQNAAEFGVGTAVSSFSGGNLSVPSRATAALETRGDRFVLTVVYKATAAPSATSPYQILQVGNEIVMAELTCRLDGTGHALLVNNQTVRIVDDITEEQTVRIVVDKIGRWCEIEGKRVPLTGAIRVTLGDGYARSTAAWGGDLTFVLGKMACAVRDAVRASLPATATDNAGPNFAPNPTFYWDQVNQGSAYNRTAAQKMDGVWVEDAGGASGTVSIQKSTFSQTTADRFFGGVMERIGATCIVVTSSPLYLGLGEWDNPSLWAGKDAGIEFTAYDNNGLDYSVAWYWRQYFGSGGSVSVDTYIGSTEVGIAKKRYFLPFRVPFIGAATIGSTLPTSRLLAVLPTDSKLLSLQVAALDVHEGARSRPFATPDQMAVLLRLERSLRVFRAIATDSTFFHGWNTSTTNFRGSIQHGQMRKSPALSTVSNFEVFSPVGAVAATGVTVEALGSAVSSINVTVASGLTSGQPGTLRAASSATSTLILDARG